MKVREFNFNMINFIWLFVNGLGNALLIIIVRRLFWDADLLLRPIELTCQRRNVRPPPPNWGLPEMKCEECSRPVRSGSNWGKTISPGTCDGNSKPETHAKFNNPILCTFLINLNHAPTLNYSRRSHLRLLCQCGCSLGGYPGRKIIWFCGFKSWHSSSKSFQ